MKNQITQFALVIIAFVAITFLMGHTRPAEEAPKQYIVVRAPGFSSEKFEQEVNQKLSEGWRLQGGMSNYNGSNYTQAMVK